MVIYSGKRMNSNSAQKKDYKRSSSFAWLKILVLLGGVGVSGSHGIAWAEEGEPIHLDELLKSEASYQTAADYLMPNESSTHVPSPSAQVGLNLPNAPAPSFSAAKQSPNLDPTVSPSTEAQMQPPVPAPPPAVVAEAPVPARSMVESLLQPSEAASTPEAANGGVVAVPTAQDVATEAATRSISPDNASTGGLGGDFIDPTDYSVGATEAPAAGPNVVFAERATGCQISVPDGQTSPISSCQQTAASPIPSATENDGGIQVGPVNVSSRGVTLGSTTVISRDFLNEKLRPLNVLRRGNEEYVFPLSIPAPITSLFGWRMHPIHQSWRFHSGTDLAAPEGTPVLATRSGRVTISDNLGGYGLTVILRHDEDQLESRYAHLSRIAVQPGEWVEQGEVIGLVGNTGTSTGPHLHFEMRQLTAQGWVAVDAQEVLEYGIANLLQIINNPLMALGQAGKPESTDDSLLQDYPFRPAQPNAS
jgi:murein DD-endopeptidase MepM/ murein hydrolase activator NlpD